MVSLGFNLFMSLVDFVGVFFVVQSNYDFFFATQSRVCTASAYQLIQKVNFDDSAREWTVHGFCLVSDLQSQNHKICWVRKDL